MSVGDYFSSNFVTTGETVGAADAINVRMNFRPSFLIVNNVTTKTIYFWQPSNGAAGATKILDSGAGTTDISTVVADGITVSDGGFNLGTGVQTTNDVVYFTAFR